MEQNLMTIIAFAAGLLAIVVSTYGAIITARVNAWSKAKLAEHGLTEAAKWQADLKAGLLTGAVWGLAPAILFLLGITDPMLHYRSRGSFQKQKEDE